MADPHDGPGTAPMASVLVGDVAAPGAGARFAQQALRAIRVHLGMDVAFIAEFTGGRRVFRYVDAASEPCPVEVGGGDPLDETYCQRVVDGRLPELIHDARAVPAAAELPATFELPVGAHLSVPIRLPSGRVYGTYCCFSSTPDHSLNDRDLGIMRVFADVTAAQIDRQLEGDRRRLETVSRLRTAVRGEGLSTVFQPIVDVESNLPVGFEALTRFSLKPHRPPDRWFEEAAAAGLGVELELAAIHQALRHLPHVPEPAYLSLNVSPATAVSGRLDAVLRNVPAHRIFLELTEHAVIDTYDDLLDALRRLRGRGVRLAVDDAGAGYASFRHVLCLQPDLIKLDVTLTRDVDVDAPRRALAAALITFAQQTGSAIVAEGVETASELRTLRALGVTAAQGYHLGRPGVLPALHPPTAAARPA